MRSRRTTLFAWLACALALVLALAALFRPFYASPREDEASIHVRYAQSLREAALAPPAEDAMLGALLIDAASQSEALDPLTTLARTARFDCAGDAFAHCALVRRLVAWHALHEASAAPVARIPFVQLQAASNLATLALATEGDEEAHIAALLHLSNVLEGESIAGYLGARIARRVSEHVEAHRPDLGPLLARYETRGRGRRAIAIELGQQVPFTSEPIDLLALVHPFARSTAPRPIVSVPERERLILESFTATVLERAKRHDEDCRAALAALATTRAPDDLWAYHLDPIRESAAFVPSRVCDEVAAYDAARARLAAR